MTYRNYYLLFLMSVVVSLGFVVMRITGALYEVYEIVDLLDYILYGIGIFVFTTYFMTDSRVSQLLPVASLKNQLLIALLVGILNGYMLRSPIVELGVQIYTTAICGIIGFKYFDKRMQMDFVGLGIIYIFFNSIILLIMVSLQLAGITLTATLNANFTGLSFGWMFYIGASILLDAVYLVVLTTKGSQMPEVTGYY